MRQLHFWKDGPRFFNVVQFVASCGSQGCIRDDLDRERVCPIQSACSPVLECLRAGVFEYTGNDGLHGLAGPPECFESPIDERESEAGNEAWNDFASEV